MLSHKILCVSFDEIVSASRVKALQDAGYQVTPEINVANAEQAMKGSKFDLVILGHRFAKSDKLELTRQAKQQNIRVLLVCGGSPESEIPADVRVYALEGTEGLVKAVQAMLPVVTAAAS